MIDILYLAWRYLRYHRLKTCVLIGSVMTIVYLPIGLNIIVGRTSRELTARAEGTPLLVGAKGSPLELVLGSLYFESQDAPVLPFSEAERIAASGLAAAIPLAVRFRTGRAAIVGTTPEYFAYRDLQIARGRRFGMLGECVLGAQAARVHEVQPGDSVLSKPESVFDIAGVYPLKMRVVGVLAPTGTPDDRAVFVDVKTTWVIQGLAHGHQDLEEDGAEGGILKRDGDRVIANASVRQYTEITPENVASFHFHGDPKTFPLTAVIAVPHDRKSATLLQGRYLSPDETAQIVRPEGVMDELLGTILTVRGYVLLAIGLVGLAAFATMGLVFVLSLQLRRREIETLVKIGGARWRIAVLLATEMIAVLTAGCTAALALALATAFLSPIATRWIVQLSG